MNYKLLILTTAFFIVLVSACSRQEARQAGANDNPTEKSTNEDDFVSVGDAAKNALKAGDQMPTFNLPNSKNEMVSSDGLLRKSNLVVVFYRGDWCPYCNLYLQRLQRRNKDLKANGGALVAISIENPDDSLTLSQKHKLDFTVLSDKNLDLARKFRIVYQLPPQTDKKYKEKGIVDLVRENGTAKPELPLSATYIVNQEGFITFAFLEPDYKKRLEPEAIIKELKKIERKS